MRKPFGIFTFCMSASLALAIAHSANGMAQSTDIWSLLCYVQADNDLAPFANYNIHDMEIAFSKYKNPTHVNMLVQWDQPQNKKTWRYRITPTGKIEDESLSAEMGINPVQEIVASMAWVKRKYPAQYYGLFLWNHGSGVEDYRIKQLKLPTKTINRLGNNWLRPPGIPMELRGILYDESQNTCLTNAGLSSALSQVKKLLGKNIDLVGMDACLMAMVEIVYQMKGYADILVASEETEPGTGWPYAEILNPLLEAPEIFDPQALAQAIVLSYGNYYSTDEPGYTQSALAINNIDSLKKNIDQVVTAIGSCKKLSPTDIKNKVILARKATQTFAIDSYIDLYSFYTELKKQCNKSIPKSAKILAKIANKKATISKRYRQELTKLNTILTDGLTKIKQIVLLNTNGDDVPDAHGISIYYPNPRYSSRAIHTSYPKTRFAQESKWLQFIKEYRTAR